MLRISINNEAEWLEKRQLQGIGGSEASSIVNCNPYLSNVELWEIKTGLKQREDIGNKPCVKYGKQAEQHIRELFRLDYPEYIVDYHEFDLLCNDDFPFIFATLDGELTDQNGRKGILEIKTTEIQQANQWTKWDNQIPQNYYVQILHQFIATGFEFAVLNAQIKYTKNGKKLKIVKTYFFERSECQDDINYLLDEEKKFYKLVIDKKRPNLQLPEI
ncbi:MAG: YqaJ viral recombinase family protein [Oscillospiraceae bacterium]